MRKSNTFKEERDQRVNSEQHHNDDDFSPDPFFGDNRSSEHGKSQFQFNKAFD